MCKIELLLGDEELREKNYQTYLLQKHPDENDYDKRCGQKSIHTFVRPSLNKIEKDSNNNTSLISSSAASDNQTLIAYFTETENSASVTKSLTSLTTKS